jgi:Ca2+-binding EF-hand superfamily protein
MSNQEALKQLIRQIFQRLNLDQSGQMSFHDMRDGLKRMPFLKPIRLTEQDFEQITLGRTLCNDEGQLELAQFEALLRREMLLYCHRQLSVSVPAVLKDDQHMGRV